MKKTDTRDAPALKRCAIYTRKSVEEGLDMEFNSLDAQREAAENYILSQKSKGWTCLPTRYDDGGFSGGNVNRPALTRLLADCEAGLVDVIVVYKIDRLSRSISCESVRVVGHIEVTPSLSFASALTGSRQSVAGSMSAKTGVAPT